MPFMKPGKEAAHWNDWKPPIDGPTTATRLFSPSESTSSFWLATMSRSVISGKVGP